MKNEVVDLFTKRIIDYSLIDWFEFIIVITIIAFIIAVIKAIAENK